MFLPAGCKWGRLSPQYQVSVLMPLQRRTLHMSMTFSQLFALHMMNFKCLGNCPLQPVSVVLRLLVLARACSHPVSVLQPIITFYHWLWCYSRNTVFTSVYKCVWSCLCKVDALNIARGGNGHVSVVYRSSMLIN